LPIFASAQDASRRRHASRGKKSATRRRPSRSHIWTWTSPASRRACC
jgi:hypothetical protein